MTAVRAILLLALMAASAWAGDPRAVPAPPRPIPPRNSGPAAVAHSRTHVRRRSTTRVIRRTPEVMREDNARVRRGDLFSTWSNEYLE
ncbi:MAG: hypothetical protein WCJ21_11435 [Planctomycetota bacterium]